MQMKYVQRQLKQMPIDKVKVDLTAPVLKTNCARWLIAAVQNLQECPVVAINGFKESGILAAVNAVVD